MENSIKSSLKQIMYNTHEYIRYKLEVNYLLNKEEALLNEANNIIKYISVYNECECSLLDMNFELIDGNIKMKATFH